MYKYLLLVAASCTVGLVFPSPAQTDGAFSHSNPKTRSYGAGYEYSTLVHKDDHIPRKDLDMLLNRARVRLGFICMVRGNDSTHYGYSLLASPKVIGSVLTTKEMVQQLFEKPVDAQVSRTHGDPYSDAYLREKVHKLYELLDKETQLLVEDREIRVKHLTTVNSMLRLITKTVLETRLEDLGQSGSAHADIRRRLVENQQQYETRKWFIDEVIKKRKIYHFNKLDV